MSLIEKALRQLEKDKQRAALSAYPGAPQPSAAAEGFYEKADDAAVGHFVEDRGALSSWKRGVTAGAALLLAIGVAALWSLQQSGEKAVGQAAPVVQLKTVPVAAVPPDAPAAAAVSLQQERKDASREGSGRFSRQQPAVSTAQPQAPKPSDPHAVQDDAGSPEVKRLPPAATQPRPQPAPTQPALRGQTHYSAAASRQPGSDLKAPRSAVSEGAANLLQRDSEDADSLNSRGVQLLEQGASAQAGDYFAQALKRSPDDEKALNNMGLSLYARGRTAEALTYYERAVKVNPDNIETYVNMGIALRSSRDFTRAAAVFQKALALSPAHPETLYNYGLLLRDMGQQEKSRSCLEQFLKNAPPHLQGVADSVRMYLQASTVKKQ